MAYNEDQYIVDSHFHIWQLKRGDYHWLTPEITTLYQDFSPQDYHLQSQPITVYKAVVIQAAETDAETDYLLSKSEVEGISAVVGWIDFESDIDNVLKRLAFLATHPAFKGVRPMLQDMDDVNWILNPDFQPIFEHLTKHNLRFDALVRIGHLSAINKLAVQYPNLKIVIDHCAKPNIAECEFVEWALAISSFATLKNIFIKVSGLTLEANAEQQSVSDFKPYFNHVYQVFGANRMMWGSDWPVLNLQSNYADWLHISQKLVEPLSLIEQQRFWSGTATEFYNLGK
ncbi:amidohydrolase family protein [Aliiglaciecola sp. 3_MG-2023]|uniref:amidohydrolase family protein n=1 Tax=Aliiglaciecola sp. 3_MG-2023 TaxID=3062644 RepID=UPI0026E331C6|nr:amidohydrolase family protein [Aliiglaciecola sp. 3_MG-2023]MDO6695312.1 amidohydrolase family protein [Aliiglaciecola sp. 3_MG-2023]